MWKTSSRKPHATTEVTTPSNPASAISARNSRLRIDAVGSPPSAGAGSAMLSAPGELPASGGEQLRLLRLEFLFCQDTAVAKLAQLLQLVDRIGRRRRSRSGSRLRLFDVLLLGLLLRPSRGLTARDAVADGGRGSGDDGSAGHSSEQSGHGVTPFRSGLGGCWVGLLRRIEGGEDGLDRNPAVGDELASGAAYGAGKRGRPAVLEHEHRRSRSRIERGTGLLEVIVGEQPRRRALEHLELLN